MIQSTLSPIELIGIKRDGGDWRQADIDRIVDAIKAGEFSSEQTAALCMAVFIRGLSGGETAQLTLAMANSGETFDIAKDIPDAVEQSSTGCVGDYGDLALLPLLAACGLPITKVSGPPLGHVNSIIGKIAATGADVHLSRDRMLRIVETAGVAVSCHSENFTPVDRALYAIRAVTGTVASLPLIASSIMSKKIALGPRNIALDVKFGSGTLVRTEDDARLLAQLMTEIGRSLDRNINVAVYEMTAPLGRCVGPALEMAQAAAVLRGKGPRDLSDHVMDLGADVLLLHGAADNAENARTRLQEAIASGKALEIMAKWIASQGGDASFTEGLDGLPKARLTREVRASASGRLSTLDAFEVGIAAVRLGAGREKLADAIDYGAGIEILAGIGDEIRQGDLLFRLHGSQSERLEEAVGRLARAAVLSDRAVERQTVRRVD